MANLYHFKRLQEEVLRFLDEDNDTSITLTSVKNALNQAHTRRLMMRDWSFMLWPVPITFTTVANQSLYSLHSEFAKPFYVFNRTTKSYVIETSPRQLGPSGVRWNTDTGSVNRFALWGRYPVKTQPSAAGVLTIVSSNVGDSGSAYAVTIVGSNSDGTGTVSETISPNGTTEVTGSVSFSSPILSVSIGSAWSGTLTLTDAADETLLSLSAGEYGRVFPYLHTLNLPTAGEVIEYRFYRQPRKLVNDYDLPDIPPPFQQILVYDALIELATYDSGINGLDLNIWQSRALELEEGMVLAFEETSALESEPRYVRYVGGESDVPRIYSN